MVAGVAPAGGEAFREDAAVEVAIEAVLVTAVRAAVEDVVANAADDAVEAARGARADREHDRRALRRRRFGIYCVVGKHLLRKGPPPKNHPYRNWLLLYASPEFAEVQKWMRKKVDQWSKTA